MTSARWGGVTPPPPAACRPPSLCQWGIMGNNKCPTGDQVQELLFRLPGFQGYAAAFTPPHGSAPETVGLMQSLHWRARGNREYYSHFLLSSMLGPECQEGWNWLHSPCYAAVPGVGSIESHDTLIPPNTGDSKTTLIPPHAGVPEMVGFMQPRLCSHINPSAYRGPTTCSQFPPNMRDLETVGVMYPPLFLPALETAIYPLCESSRADWPTLFPSA